MRTSDHLAGEDSPPLGDGAWCRATDVVGRHLRDRLLLLPVAGGEPVCLTGPGVDVWELLAEPMTLHDVVDLLSQAYGVPESTVRRDLSPLLTELVDRGLIVRRAA